MRRAGIPLAALLAAAPPVIAQVPPGAVPPAAPAGQRVPIPGTPVAGQPGGFAGVPAVAGPAAAPAPTDPALMAHLQQWEAVMQGTTNFYATCSLTKKNLVKNKTSQHSGSIVCLKPSMARMRIAEVPQAGEKADPNSYLAYICTGRAVYQYDGPVKQVTEYPLPNGGVGDNLLLTFMSGTLRANDIVARFDIRLLKEDPHYVYLEIRPREARDKAEFETLTLVLFNKTVPQLAYLPRSVVMRNSNGQDEEYWDFPQPRVNVEGIKPADFQPVLPASGLPADWKVQRAQVQAPPPGQPRVARPQGQP